MLLLDARRLPTATLFLVAVLGTSTVLAQTALPTITSSGAVALPTASSGSAAATSGSDATDSGSSTGDATTSASLPELSSKSAVTTAKTSSANLPALSTSTIPPGLPSLPGGYSYPAPTVPPMANAPYLQKSKLPQDTVFIIVGAVIAFVAVVILAWRILVAWSINRSVRNATIASYSQIGESKGGRKKSVPGTYGPPPVGSTISLEKLGTNNRHTNPNSKSHTPNASLFFSPTAGAGMHSSLSNRASTYLPSGYYSAGNSAPGGGASTTTIGGGVDRGSKLRPASSVNSRPIDPSPPDSPDIRPSTGGQSILDSRSSLNLIPSTTGDRTPSTYLDDLMSTGVPHVPRHGHSSSRHSFGGDIRRY